MLLKHQLEYIWRHPKVACPLHRTCWHQTPLGYKFTVWNVFMTTFGLYYTRGRLVGPQHYYYRNRH